MSTTATPLAGGYRWPAEWEPHAATWLVWPHNPDTWPGAFERVPPVYVEMVRALVAGERVEIVVQSDAHRAQVRALLADGSVPLERVRFHVIRTNDSWVRDSGPIFLRRAADPRLAAVAWGYNSWGGKYPPWDLDDALAEKIAASAGASTFVPGMILEGGSIEGDGEGTILTTSACLLHPTRNPTLDRAGLEERLASYLGCDRAIWLGDGIVGDDTDGHVDDLTRFVKPGVVVTVVESDPGDENHAVLEENLEHLRGARDARGRALEIVTLPMPRPVVFQGERLPASYANFYIGNAAVLVPTFRDPNDEVALATLRRLFPDRRVTGIHASDLVVGLGAFHCLTQQQPQ